MNEIFRIFCCHTVLLLYCGVYGEDDSKSFIDDWVPELYSLYKEAFINDKKYLARRMYKGDEQFMLHVQKLREVNGLKTHNLKLEQRSLLRKPSSIIYINNPVEAELPNAFLTAEQFKSAMVKQIEKQKTEFRLNKNIHPSKKIIKHSKHADKVNLGKFKGDIIFTHTIPKIQSSTNTPIEYGEHYETLFDSQGNQITDVISNIINYQKTNDVTEATTEAKNVTTVETKTEDVITTMATTESTSEIVTEAEEETKDVTETTINSATDTSAEETTETTYKAHEEETTQRVQSTGRTPLPRPYVFLGSQF